MSSIQVVDTLEALDAALDRAAAARAQSDDAYRKTLSDVMLRPDRMLGKLPQDPTSDEYRAAQLRFYEQLTQRTYAVDNEATKFNREHMLRWPFPYATRSAVTVGRYLMMYGEIIREMNLPASANILEMGSGYGPLTHQMASMGYRVTCADISEDLLDYVRTRCAGLPGPVETIRCDMNDFTATGVYDAIVFFESFHHVLDHAELLRRIGDCLADDGILVFAGEPIVPGDSDVVPYPWGLRMDGMSLWAIRRQGWLELGFRLDYFNEVLRRTGWTYRCVQSIASPGTDIWICRRALKNPGNAGNANEPLYVWHASDAVIMTQCGRRDPEQGTLQSQGQAGYLAYGPYKPLEAGTYEIIWKGALEGEVSTAVAEVACRAGQDVLREIAMTRDSGVLARTKFHLREAVVDMEFRVRVGAHDVIELRSIELRKID